MERILRGNNKQANQQLEQWQQNQVLVVVLPFDGQKSEFHLRLPFILLMVKKKIEWNQAEYQKFRSPFIRGRQWPVSDSLTSIFSPFHSIPPLSSSLAKEENEKKGKRKTCLVTLQFFSSSSFISLLWTLLEICLTLQGEGRKKARENRTMERGRGIKSGEEERIEWITCHLNVIDTRKKENEERKDKAIQDSNFSCFTH